MIFGTSNLRGLDTEMKVATSKYYQCAWAAFARAGLGWLCTDADGQTSVKSGKLNGASQLLDSDYMIHQSS